MKKIILILWIMKLNCFANDVYEIKYFIKIETSFHTNNASKIYPEIEVDENFNFINKSNNYRSIYKLYEKRKLPVRGNYKVYYKNSRIYKVEHIFYKNSNNTTSEVVKDRKVIDQIYLFDEKEREVYFYNFKTKEKRHSYYDGKQYKEILKNGEAIERLFYKNNLLQKYISYNNKILNDVTLYIRKNPKDKYKRFMYNNRGKYIGPERFELYRNDKGQEKVKFVLDKKPNINYTQEELFPKFHTFTLSKDRMAYITSLELLYQSETKKEKNEKNNTNNPNPTTNKL